MLIVTYYCIHNRFSTKESIGKKKENHLSNLQSEQRTATRKFENAHLHEHLHEHNDNDNIWTKSLII